MCFRFSTQRRKTCRELIEEKMFRGAISSGCFATTVVGELGPLFVRISFRPTKGTEKFWLNITPTDTVDIKNLDHRGSEI